jgi:superfamily II DNA or RNA helicase
MIGEALKASKKALVVMATGTGKTVVGAFAIKEPLKLGRGLFLCHNNRILEQSMKQFAEVLGPEVTLGVFHGEKKHWDEVDILFASFQTFVDWKHAFFEDEFRFVIVDESHHSQAITFKEVIEYFKPAELLALTATPDRMDQKDIREIFGQEVVNITLEEAIGKGWLAQVEYHLVTDNLNHWELKKLAREVLEVGKKISLKQLNETIFIKARDEKIAEKIQSYGKKKTIVFCESIVHAENFQKFLPRSKVYHSKVSIGKNEETLNEFRSGECQCILVVDKFNEGLDIPDAELIVFLRCTDSKTVYLQQLGRGLRKTLNKDKVIVLDFVGNTERVMMIREMIEKVKFFTINWAELERNPLHVQGDGFDFVFTDELIDLFSVLQRLQLRYISDVPELLAEYSDKNELLPSEVVAGTMRRLWWVCSKCGHEWLTSGSHRLRAKSGCPACLNRAVTSKNNLAVTHPELAKEYSPRNLLPATQIIAGSMKKLWWKCSKPECGHEWQATGNARLRGGNIVGCPACCNRVAGAKNNLAVTHPDLAKEYSPRNPLPATSFVAGTNRKLWWKCLKPDCGYEWQTTGANRVSGKGCPACCNRAVTPKNNLAVTHPDLAKEYSPRNPLLANQIVAGSTKKLWWKCLKPECGHEWQATGLSRVSAGTGCPACAGNVVTPRNNLTVTHPDLVKEYSPKNLLPATQVNPGTNRKLWWKCSKPECGHEWQASCYHRTKGVGCPACVNKVVTTKNNLTVTHPELAKEYSPKNSLPATQVVAGTNKKLWWKCSKPECGHEWHIEGSARVQGYGCPACVNKVVTTKNNLAVTHPELAKEYSPRNPLPADRIIAGSTKRLWWVCSKCGHEWLTSGSHRAVNKSGCPKCCNRGRKTP